MGLFKNTMTRPAGPRNFERPLLALAWCTERLKRLPRDLQLRPRPNRTGYDNTPWGLTAIAICAEVD